MRLTIETDNDYGFLRVGRSMTVEVPDAATGADISQACSDACGIGDVLMAWEGVLSFEVTDAAYRWRVVDGPPGWVNRGWVDDDDRPYLDEGEGGDD